MEEVEVSSILLGTWISEMSMRQCLILRRSQSGGATDNERDATL